jgi:glycosyltransferase involved in cell wall biosynthesis
VIDRSAVVPSCTVVVCTRNRPDALSRCLEALSLQSYRAFDVLVVDNASADRTAHDVAHRWGAGYLVEPVVGLSRARNAGARACQSDIVAFTDDDAVPDQAWLASLVERFQDPSVAVVTGRTLSFPGSPEEYGADIGPQRIALNSNHPCWVEMACFGGIGNGNNMAFRRWLFDTWEGFDERLGRGAMLSGGEEHRAFADVIGRGHTVTYTPDAVVYHPVATGGEQYLRTLADLAGLTLFLFLATPHKWTIVKYAFEAALGVKRSWRYRTARTPATAAPHWEVLQAYVAGVLRCLWVCSSARRRRDRTIGAPTRAMRVPPVSAITPQFRRQ